MWRQEVFGPVVVCCPFRDEEHAIELANDSDYSLGASVWSSDVSEIPQKIRSHPYRCVMSQHALASRVTSRLHSGVVWVNTHHRNDPASPWGSLQTKTNSSGIGRENGLSALDAYTQLQSISYSLACEETRRQNEDWFKMGASRYG
jgi:acyl-CoA reductase-like NAD-dependent aldehyde dehydrogenase